MERAKEGKAEALGQVRDLEAQASLTETYKRDLDETKASLARLSDRIHVQQGALREREAANEALRKTLAEWQAADLENDKLKERVQELERTVEQQESLRSEAEKELKAVRLANRVWEKDTSKLESQIEELQSDSVTMMEQLDSLQEKLQDSKGSCKALQDELDCCRAESRNAGGRPKGHAGREELELKWDSMNPGARRKALYRHTNDIISALLSAGAIDWLPSCLALALKQTDLLPELLSSRIFAEHKLEFAQHLGDVLAAEWGVGLALFVRSELTLSDRDYEKLRLAFCKRYSSSVNRWVKRVWYKCPVTGNEIYLPEPLVSKYKWMPAWRSALEKHGLALSKDGKVAERSLLESMRKSIAHDLSLLFTPTVERPWIIVFGIDGTAVSGKRKFSHATGSLAYTVITRMALLSQR